MDLAGPKLRTGPIEPGPLVIKVQPARDVFGRVQANARIWISSSTNPCPAPTPANASLLVAQKWLNCLEKRETIKFKDARHARRSIRIVDVTPNGVWAEADKTTYLTPGILLCRAKRI